MRLRVALAIVAFVFASVAGAWAEPRTIVVYTFLDGTAPSPRSEAAARRIVVRLATTSQDEVRIAPVWGVDFGENAGNLGASRYVTGTLAEGSGGLLHITVRGWRSLDNLLLNTLTFEVPTSGALVTADLSTLFGGPPSIAPFPTLTSAPMPPVPVAPARATSVMPGTMLRFTVIKAIGETERDDQKYKTTRLLVDQLQGRGYTATLSAVDPSIDIRASATAICADGAANTILAPTIKRATSSSAAGTVFLLSLEVNAFTCSGLTSGSYQRDRTLGQVPPPELWLQTVAAMVTEIAERVAPKL